MPPHGGFDPERLLAAEAARRQHLPPESLLPDFLYRRDETLIDYGCGAGFFTIPAARYLTGGRVWALDRDPRMVAATTERARREGLPNVAGLVADGDVPALPPADAVLMANVFHDLDDPDAVLRRLHPLLQPHGRLYLVEWLPVPTEMGPPLAIRIGPEALAARLEAAGFEVRRLFRDPYPFYRVLAGPV
ncbi:protein of unknown function [Candidatus Hydrogenisulfobacillus filiaventi]|uniref:Methyltransferase type 12 domain-containing protein n=1 Tax=Candidatus Hydrogenisulfobacillus filiaventi TaxID=2707344 RepID=A0A6F8ZKN9_9FIRM|nr:class I SAM-dependent methyltransferase [Bacillota bacterium]CAB1130253.1 protein of unknown function [Candidatus Hydrogenisulfobacillus filiaventi]